MWLKSHFITCFVICRAASHRLLTTLTNCLWQSSNIDNPAKCFTMTWLKVTFPKDILNFTFFTLVTLATRENFVVQHLMLFECFIYHKPMSKIYLWTINRQEWFICNSLYVDILYHLYDVMKYLIIIIFDPKIKIWITT